MTLDISTNTILTITFGAISTISVVLLQRKTERLKIVEGQLSQKKYTVYYDLVSLFFDLIKGTKAGTPIDSESFIGKMIDIKKELFIYGSDEIINKLSEWLIYISKPDPDIRHIRIFLDVLILVRKDMGDPRTKINRKDIMLLIMQNEEKYNKFIAPQ